MHDYFNEPFSQARCGHCDNCIHPIEEQLGHREKASDAAIASSRALDHFGTAGRYLPAPILLTLASDQIQRELI